MVPFSVDGYYPDWLLEEVIHRARAIGDDGCADGICASDDGAGAVVCCAIALNAISREAVIIHFQVRMTNPLSCLVRQLENDVYNRSRVYRLIEMLGRLESHLVGRRDRSLVQAMTQTADHAIHV